MILMYVFAGLGCSVATAVLFGLALRRGWYINFIDDNNMLVVALCVSILALAFWPGYLFAGVLYKIIRTVKGGK